MQLGLFNRAWKGTVLSCALTALLLSGCTLVAGVLGGGWRDKLSPKLLQQSTRYARGAFSAALAAQK
jgi:hypothetical protein